jgi:hypothetical protein
MMMLSFIDAIKRKFIDQYKFPESETNKGCPVGVPDGTYPMTIEDKEYQVVIKDDMISF